MASIKTQDRISSTDRKSQGRLSTSVTPAQGQRLGEPRNVLTSQPRENDELQFNETPCLTATRTREAEEDTSSGLPCTHTLTYMQHIQDTHKYK